MHILGRARKSKWRQELAKKCSWKILVVITSYLIFIYATALFSNPPLIGKGALPPHLQNKKHIDYTLPGTKWIPWGWSSWHLVEPPWQYLGNQIQEAKTIDGQFGPSPIPEAGSWQFSLVQMKKDWPLLLPYFAFTTKSGWHFRLGCRWDDVDHYYVFPSFAWHKI